jgi:hypothetical protein
VESACKAVNAKGLDNTKSSPTGNDMHQGEQVPFYVHIQTCVESLPQYLPKVSRSAHVFPLRELSLSTHSARHWVAMHVDLGSSHGHCAAKQNKSHWIVHDIHIRVIQKGCVEVLNGVVESAPKNHTLVPLIGLLNTMFSGEGLGFGPATRSYGIYDYVWM